MGKKPDQYGKYQMIINPLYDNQINNIPEFTQALYFKPHIHFHLKKRGAWHRVKRRMRLNVMLYTFYDPENIQEGEEVSIWIYTNTSYINLYRQNIIKQIVARALVIMDDVSDPDKPIGFKNWAYAYLSRIDVMKSVSGSQELLADDLDDESPYSEEIELRETLEKAREGRTFREAKQKAEEVT